MDKPGKGSFYATDLDSILKTRGITHLLVCGVTTEVCVHTTVREANDRGYECLVLSDCVASYFPEFQRVALEMIKAQGGIFGWVAPSSALLAALEAEPVAAPACSPTRGRARRSGAVDRVGAQVGRVGRGCLAFRPVELGRRVPGRRARRPEEE